MRDQVYLLYHIRDSGQLLLVGAYQSEADARTSIDRLKTKPGFVQFPDDFEIHGYELGVELWPDGFSADEEVFSCDGLPEKPLKRVN
ncbi:MAG: hypothetical protein ABSB60_04880 [Terracidiphilus sp.]|jgi:hypothetical protein